MMSKYKWFAEEKVSAMRQYQDAKFNRDIR